MLKEKNFQPRILYIAKISFRNKDKIKASPDEEKLREFVPSRPALKELLKRIL